MNTAVIVAAGGSQRFGAEKPKQFLEILGKPIVIHTLLRFEACPVIDEIILVLPRDDLKIFAGAADKYQLTKLCAIVAGGRTRTESVLNGFKSIARQDVEVVAIHDGARPLVTVDEITKVVSQALETGAVCLMADVTDTIKEVMGGKIVSTIDRRRLKRALTPQAFRYEILKRAFAENNLDKDATDECFLVEKLGVEIATVEGSSKNIKITYPEDFVIAEYFLRAVES